VARKRFRSPRPSSVTKQTWIIAAFLSGALALALLWLQARGAVASREEALGRLRTLAEQSSALSETNRHLASELERIRSEAAALQEEVEASTQARLTMEQQFRSDLESKDVTISELQGRLTVNILDRVLFDSGEARLKPDGEAVLAKVAVLLGKYPSRQVQVAGHTDDVPIRNRTADGFTDNWALSAGRATAAVRCLVEKGGVDPKRIAAVGFGEFRPVAENATPEGRARNRRIAVVVLPEEVAPVERQQEPSQGAQAVPPAPGETRNPPDPSTGR